MKPTRLFGVLLMLLAGSAFSQPTISDSKTLYPADIAIFQKNGAGGVYGYGSYHIGKEIAGPDIYIYRSYFDFSIDLSTIPDNATINQVDVVYYTSGSGYNFKLTQPSAVGVGHQEDWEAIGDGSSLKTGVPYGSDSFESEDLKEEIQDALSSNELVIGALSESEGTSGS